MPKERIGELSAKQLEVCQKLGCTLLTKGTYFMCTVKAARAGDRNTGTLQSIVGLYKSQIPSGCPKKYDEVQPSGSTKTNKSSYIR